MGPGSGQLRPCVRDHRPDHRCAGPRDRPRGIASITKTFTATAVLQLVDQGRIGLDDHLSTYVGGVDNGDRITVRQLLDMTAGVYDYTADDGFGKRFYANPARPFGPRQFFAILRRHKPAFAPGAAAMYSDSNYHLLGLILEKVTGRTAERVITDQIITPLGLRHTSFPTVTALPRPFASGYFGGLDGAAPLTDATSSNPGAGWTAGGMVSTLGDLHRWARVLATGTLLSKQTQAARLTTVSFHNPGPVRVGYGLGVFELDHFLGHNGAIVGYSSAMFYLPSKDATIVVWGNNSTNSTTPTTTIIFDLARVLSRGRCSAGAYLAPLVPSSRRSWPMSFCSALTCSRRPRISASSGPSALRWRRRRPASTNSLVIAPAVTVMKLMPTSITATPVRRPSGVWGTMSP